MNIYSQIRFNIIKPGLTHWSLRSDVTFVYKLNISRSELAFDPDVPSMERHIFSQSFFEELVRRNDAYSVHIRRIKFNGLSDLNILYQCKVFF
jgi:hypothetical protein